MQKYERRGRHVQEGEQGKWKDVDASMMSDEEPVGGKFRVHRQEWRSPAFNDLMNTLDSRAETGRPRIERVDGTPSKVSAPRNVSEWMIAPAEDGEILAPQSPDVIGNGDSD